MNKKQELMKELRALSIEELSTRIVESELEMSNLKFQAVSQPLESPVKLRDLRRNIARMKTLISQKQNTVEVAND